MLNKYFVFHCPLSKIIPSIIPLPNTIKNINKQPKLIIKTFLSAFFEIKYLIKNTIKTKNNNVKTSNHKYHNAYKNINEFKTQNNFFLPFLEQSSILFPIKYNIISAIIKTNSNTNNTGTNFSTIKLNPKKINIVKKFSFISSNKKCNRNKIYPNTTKSLNENKFV